MKKLATLLTLILAVGFVYAQDVSASVQQKVDAKAAQWEKKIEVTDAQKEEIKGIWIKYETLIENERKSMKEDRSNLDDINAKVNEYKVQMREETNAALTPEQKAQLGKYRKDTK